MRSILIMAAALLLLAQLPALAADQCTTIQDGTLLTSANEVIKTGYDKWGYNYQARKFRGGYCDAYRDAEWCQEWDGVDLIMKWNDAWLSNKDCTDDGLLDRYYGHSSYIGSGAWLTNHQKGYYWDNGRKCRFSYFVKIVAAPADASLVGGDWYAADGTLIGEEIWGAFAIIQQVEYDRCTGARGQQFVSPYGAGFGKYGPQ
jgi:hypothetical protein